MISQRIFPTLSPELTANLFANSTLCSVMLITGDVVLCTGYSYSYAGSDSKNFFIAFNPVIVDGFIDESQTYQFFFKSPNIATSDQYYFYREEHILAVSAMDDKFKNEYIKYFKEKEQRLKEKEELKKDIREVDLQNVVSINTTKH